MLARFFRTAAALMGGRPGGRDMALLDQYVDALPSAQTAIDAVPGWNHAMPPQIGAVAGSLPLYADPRVAWCLEQFGPIGGRKILELGPLEGMHTYQLDQHDPQFIHAIEANRLAFLRCLITKELLQIRHARFLLGNFLAWLEHTDIQYDLIFASGVLYHMTEPLRLLELMARRSNTIYLWTHYYGEAAMPKGDPRRSPFLEEVDTGELRGVRVALHRRGYRGAWMSKAYCGGMHDRHYWMEKEGIVDILRALGFSDIRMAHDQPDHPAGPSVSIFACRHPPADAERDA